MPSILTIVWCESILKYRRILPITATLAIIALLSVSSISYTNAATPLDSIIIYMIAEDLEPTIGDIVNITAAIRNALNNTIDIYNATMEFHVQRPELNITNVFNTIAEDPNYNSTLYLENKENSVPIFWWNQTYVNSTWAKFESNSFQSFWFEVNCSETSEFSVSISDIILTYYYENGTEVIFEGEPFSFERINSPYVESQINVPPLAKIEWYWWLVGSSIIGVPVIVIIITRLTLWKR